MRAVLPWLVLLGGCGPSSDEGFRAYGEGRYQEAAAAFARAAEATGAAAAWYDLSLAALRAGDLRAGEIAAEKAAVFGDAAFRARRDFVLGHAAFVRCRQAAEQARQPEADPAAYDLALARARDALGFWERAAASRRDWPAARRNVERALLALDGLERAKREAEEQRRARRERRPRPLPDFLRAPEGEGRARQEPAPVPDPQGEPEGWARGDLRAVLEQLSRLEGEKDVLRRRRQRARARPGERDW